MSCSNGRRHHQSQRCLDPCPLHLMQRGTDWKDRSFHISSVARIMCSPVAAAVSLSQRLLLGRPDRTVCPAAVMPSWQASVAPERGMALARCEVLSRPADSLRTTRDTTHHTSSGISGAWVVPDVAPAALSMRGESATAEAYQEPTPSPAQPASYSNVGMPSI